MFFFKEFGLIYSFYSAKLLKELAQENKSQFHRHNAYRLNSSYYDCSRDLKVTHTHTHTNTHTENVHTHPTTTTTTTITITTNASNRTLNLHHVFLAFQRRPQRRERRAGCNQRGGCTSRGNEAKDKSNQADKQSTASTETVQKRQSTTTAAPQQEAHE